MTIPNRYRGTLPSVARLCLILCVVSFIAGCGGDSGAVGGTDLNSEESKAKADAARAAYTGGARSGPTDEKSSSGGPPPGRGL